MLTDFEREGVVRATMDRLAPRGDSFVALVLCAAETVRLKRQYPGDGDNKLTDSKGQPLPQAVSALMTETLADLERDFERMEPDAVVCLAEAALRLLKARGYSVEKGFQQ